MSSPETNNASPEKGRGAESLDSAAEQLEKLANQQERGAELSPRDAEALAERARLEALDNAISVEAGGAEKNKPRDAYRPRQRQKATKRQRNESFKRQMKDVRRDMSLPSVMFSKVVHNPVVEKASDVVGSTVARPNALLAGSFCAFALTLGVYVVAKTIGYQLSGFETIGAFFVGWLIGIIYDYLRIIITGKK